MTTKLVIDRIWVRDYIDHIKEQVIEVEQISESLNKAKKDANPSRIIIYEKAIDDIMETREELIVICEVLEQYFEGIDNAKAILEGFVKEMKDTLFY